MSAPSVVVARPPDGWTHIGGPGMHLLIGLDEEDERTLTASDAADAGDLDDVIEVLTRGGMRTAIPFVGVHWKPTTRIVAFGPAAAMVTLADGTVREVRATSSRVWTDLELDDDPTDVALRVLTASERDQSPPTGAAPGSAPGTPDDTSGAAGADGGDGGDEGDSGGDPTPALGVEPRVEPGVEPDAVAAVEPGEDVRSESGSTGAEPADPSLPRAIPTFEAGRSEEPGAPRSPWVGGWGAPAAPTGQTPAAPASTRDSAAEADAVTETEAQPVAEIHLSPAPPALRAWASVSPSVATRPAGPDAPSGRPAAGAADRDVHSTWAQRPSPEAPAVGPPMEPDTADQGIGAAGPGRPGPSEAGVGVASLPERDPSHEGDRTPPSYDYLFGHTSDVAEHRKFLASLQPEVAEDDSDSSDSSDLSQAVHRIGAGADAILTTDGVTDPSAASNEPSSTIAASAPTPVNSVSTAGGAAEVSPAPTGGLISSVPWATSTPTPTPATDPGERESPTPAFTGRHTPAPTPSLLPPMAIPPSGPSVTAFTVEVPTTVPGPSGTTPAPTPLAPTPAAPIAGVTPTPGSDADELELTVDRSALIEAREAARNATISGPSVLAVLCSAGHPSPPHSATCRVCGAAVPQQEPFRMARPTLGVLRLSTGDVVRLDRSVLLGRAPTASPGLSATEVPHVVKVASPERDVSRNHVEVVIEDWHVLVRDLATTNGTTVALPGQPPLRLRANDQQMLEPGSVVSMADEVSFTFEVGE